MIKNIVQRVRGWSSFVKFMIVATTIVFLIDSIINGYHHALPIVVPSVTVLVLCETVVSPVASLVYIRRHAAAGVPMYCGDRTAPTATDWHRMIVGVLGLSLFIVMFGWAFYTPLTLDALSGTALYVALNAVVLTAVVLAVDWLHFLDHRRRFRLDAAERQAVRESASLDKKFWGVVHDNYGKPDTGSIA